MDVIVAPLTIKPVASIVPLTLTLPEENIKFAPALCEIEELLIVISSTSNSPAVILPAVVIELDPLLMSPKLAVIEPAPNAPTVVILVLPDEEPKIASASDLVYLSVKAAFTLVSKLDK